jgi:DNA-directed RNA polymerase beta subunit
VNKTKMVNEKTVSKSNFTSAASPKNMTISTSMNLNNNDMYLVGDLELVKKKLVNHHIESMNELYEIGIDQIITRVFKIEKDIVDLKPAISDDEKNINYVHLEINFSNVTIGKPMMVNYNSSKEEVLFPNLATRIEKTYSSTIRVDATIKETIWMKNGSSVQREGQLKEFNLGKIPIMVKSKLCHTYKLPKKVLHGLHEDPTDPGGYFIVNGGEWAIDSVESILFNKVRIFKNEGYQKELYRVEFISRPGDFYLNSDEFIIRMTNDGQCTIEIARDQLKGKLFPFYVIFRILGWESDRDIWKNIVMNEEGPLTVAISNELQNAFNAKYQFMSKARDIYNKKELLYYLADELKPDFKKYDLSSDDAMIKLTQSILEKIDTHFLPHMGFTKESRLNKLRFLGLVFNKLYLTKLGVLDPTDRDSFNNKRIHAAGTSYAKIIKTHLNASVIQQVKRAFIRNFKSQSAFTIDLETSLKASIHGIEFGRSITQSITAGNKSQITINKKKRTNRLSSQLLNRRNQLNSYSILRAVTTTSADNAKQSERANEIRRVHMSFLGYICCVHSPEGEKVGINKQLAIFASITRATFGEVIKNMILDDREFIALDKISVSEISKKGLCNVFVNGDWIGVCPNALQFTMKYRNKRRSLEISPEVTIVWDSREDEVYFWTDVGRVIRPLIIVYNNKRDKEFFAPADQYNEKKRNFIQNIALTQTHIDKILAKQITIDDLLKDRVVEYISAEEQENMYICASYTMLQENQNNELREYTHCDIEQAQLGITSLISPMSTHNAVVRSIFLTSQARQTCSIYALNWMHRSDKEGLVQYQSETPLVKTAINRYLFPNGNMAMIAVMCYTGYNQEDSLVVSKGSVERGLFDASKMTFYKTKLEQREEFAAPTHATEKIRVACYDKLVNGIVTVGTIVYKDDALIGKIAKVPSGDRGTITVDRSVIYKDSEPAIVHDVIIDRNEQDERIAKVVLRKIRPVSIGDKFSSRAGQKAVCGILLNDSDMPFTKNGMRPDAILNPHCMPSRMTVGQMFEMVTSKYCAEVGSHIDGTPFRSVDLESIYNELEDMGYNRHGYERLYSGITGEYIDTMIFFAPMFYQRLQKFASDALYHVTQGPSDPLTMVPVEGGKANSGGLRIGELEYSALVAQGVSRVMKEKLYDHSDAYTQYYCQCGREPIVNTHQSPPILKCRTCGDNAVISQFPTSYSAKLFRHEIQGMGVGLRVHGEPFIFEVAAENIVHK